MDSSMLLQQKQDLEQQLSELAGLFDGLDKPAISEKVANLEVQKAELSGRLSKLSSEIESAETEISGITEYISKCTPGATKLLLDAISKHRIFSIINKPKLIFDSQTGCLFPNKDLLPDALNYFKRHQFPHHKSEDLASEVYSGWHAFSIKNIEGYENFNLPTDQNIAFYVTSAQAVIGKKIKYSLCSRSYRDDDRIICFLGAELCANYFSGDDIALAFPFSTQFTSKDFSPDNKVFSPEERAQKVLNLFVQEGWIPKFEDEEITKLYERMHVTRPALIQTLTKIKEQLAAMPAPKLGFADGIDFDDLIKEYNLAAIRSSHVQYYAETILWFDNLLTNLDSFIHEHADLLSEAQTLTNRLTVAHHDDEYPVLTERADYLARHLDFGVETLQSELIAFKNEAMAGRDILANSRNLASLREIEKLERPDFYLVAEHTSGMVKRQLAGVDWFREHKELAATLIDLHETWRDDFHLFEHTTRDHFIQKCRDESIADEQADGWFAEWRKERLLLEEHLLPLMKSGIEKVIPVEVVIAAVDVLKTSIRDKLEKFFKEERVELYNEPECRQTNGALLERLKRDNRLAHINFEFQKSLEELIFRVETTEGRQFLVEWAKECYDTPITSVLVYIEKDTLHEESAQMILDEFRAMKSRNFNTFLIDARSYAEARRKIENKWNSLMRRMEEDLKKKNGTGKDGA